MAKLFSRIKNSIEADLHNLLDQKEQKNPVLMLNQYLRECEKEVEKVRKLIERQYLLKEEFTKEYVRAKDLAEKRKHQAEVAQKAGEHDLYEFVVNEQMQYEERAERLNDSRQLAAKQLEELERKYEEMKHKLKDMQLKKLELMGRENIARAQYQANKMLSETDKLNQPYSRFSEIESYLDRIEQQVNTAFFRNTLDGRIVQLEKQLKEQAN